MLALKKTKQTSRRKGKILLISQCVIIIASTVVGVIVVKRAFNEDKKQQDFSDKYYLPAVQDYNAHHYPEAIKELKVNLKAFPDDYKANFEMGLVLMRSNKRQEARTYFVNAQNSFLSHHGRFSTWERYNAAQHEIDKIDYSMSKKL